MAQFERKKQEGNNHTISTQRCALTVAVGRLTRMIDLYIIEVSVVDFIEHLVFLKRGEEILFGQSGCDPQVR